MTGRELIIYILENKLEDKALDSIASKIFMTEEDTASKFNVGVGTIRAWYALHLLEGVTIGDSIFVFADSKSPIIKN